MGGGTISLGKSVEYKVEFILHNADAGVHDAELQGDTLVIKSEESHAEHHKSFVGHPGWHELDSIANEVCDNLEDGANHQ